MAHAHSHNEDKYRDEQFNQFHKKIFSILDKYKEEPIKRGELLTEKNVLPPFDIWLELSQEEKESFRKITL